MAKSTGVTRLACTALWFLITTAPLLVCSFRTSRASSNTTKVDAVAGIGRDARALWQSYVDGVRARYNQNSGVQPACMPQLYENTGGSYQGVIMLFHGFTACPQQFQNLIPKLTEAGYVVLTPLNPGHGYNSRVNSSGEIEDYIEDMPTAVGPLRDFGNEMNRIMQAAQGQKVVFGMSLGGAIASYVGYRGTYNRRFLAAPMVRVAGFLDQLISLANFFPDRRYERSSWGEGCEAERRAGRQGICQFNPAIGAASRDFGQGHLYEVNRPASGGDLQVVFVDKDQAVSTNAVRNLALKFGIDRNSKYVCGFDAAVGHSFLSPFDNPTEDKYWLQEVTQKVVNYLVRGDALAQGGGDFGGWPRCELRSTPR